MARSLSDERALENSRIAVPDGDRLRLRGPAATIAVLHVAWVQHERGNLADPAGKARAGRRHQSKLQHDQDADARASRVPPQVTLRKRTSVD